MLKKLWSDESGAIVSSELILVATILVIGVITGMNAVRVAVVSEMADVGAAFAAVNQSYNYDDVLGHHAWTAGSEWTDKRDTCDDGIVQDGRNARCIVVGASANRGENR